MRVDTGGQESSKELKIKAKDNSGLDQGGGTEGGEEWPDSVCPVLGRWSQLGELLEE